MRCVRILLPLPLTNGYDYFDPNLNLQEGDFVRVAFGSRIIQGVVWQVPAPESDQPKKDLRSVLARLTVPQMTEELRRSIDWIADYTLSPVGSVLRMAINSLQARDLEYKNTPSRLQFSISLVEKEHQPKNWRHTPARKRVLAALEKISQKKDEQEDYSMSLAELSRLAHVSPSVIEGLIKLGILRKLITAPPRPCYYKKALTNLSHEQAQAAQALRHNISQRQFSVTLLDGVTGSGKTIVCFDALEATMATGRQILVLLPEIALITNWKENFKKQFGVTPVVWHSDLGRAARRASWHNIAHGQTSVVIGTRSALFLPFPDLGLIIVDEEHDATFKQDQGVLYHARDMAVLRARMAKASIILASATPSLETIVNVNRGKYHRLILTNRHGSARMPEVIPLDLRRRSPISGQFLAPDLIEALQTTRERGEQALLFLNRRGYAPLTLCRACGYRFHCPWCSAWLVSHRTRKCLQCHHCGHTEQSPTTCPECRAQETLAECGPGVERVVEEVNISLGHIRTATITSETSARATAELWSQMHAGEIDILIGTQLVAKGHNFPNLTLVGVVDADLGLGGADLRAAERSFQLLHQVGGRAGRGSQPGRVFLQTYSPEHDVIRMLTAGDRNGFLAYECASRARARMPPFGRLAALILSGHDASRVEAAACTVARTAPHFAGWKVLGPAPAPLSRLRGSYRWRLLVHADLKIKIQKTIRSWLNGVQIPPRVSLRIDIDPVNFL